MTPEQEFRAAIVEACRKFDVRISGDSQAGDLRVDGVADSRRGWICMEVGPEGWRD